MGGCVRGGPQVLHEIHSFPRPLPSAQICRGPDCTMCLYRSGSGGVHFKNKLCNFTRNCVRHVAIVPCMRLHLACSLYLSLISHYFIVSRLLRWAFWRKK